MPEYGLFNGFNRSDIDRPPDFPLPKILEQEAERQKQTQEAQKAAIRMSQSATDLLRQSEKNTAELKRIADATEQRAKLAEQKAEAAKKEAAQSKRQSRISNIFAAFAILIAILSWLVPRTDVINFLSSFWGIS